MKSQLTVSRFHYSLHIQKHFTKNLNVYNLPILILKQHKYSPWVLTLYEIGPGHEKTMAPVRSLNSNDTIYCPAQVYIRPYLADSFNYP